MNEPQTAEPTALEAAFVDPLGNQRRAEKVADYLIELAEQELTLKLEMQMANDGPDDPAIIKGLSQTGQEMRSWIPDPEGGHHDDETNRNFKTFQQRLDEIDQGRKMIRKGQSDKVLGVAEDIINQRKGAAT